MATIGTPLSNIDFESNIFERKTVLLREDNRFIEQVHDPEVLAKLNDLKFTLSSLQRKEIVNGQHCCRAPKDDYPWGTVKCEDGTPPKKPDDAKVACRCINLDTCGMDSFKKCCGRKSLSKEEKELLKENEKWKAACELFEAQYEKIKATMNTKK